MEAILWKFHFQFHRYRKHTETEVRKLFSTFLKDKKIRIQKNVKNNSKEDS